MGEAFKGLEPPVEVVGGGRVAKKLYELDVSFVVVALSDRFLNRAVYPLDLTVGPGMTRMV